MIEEIFNLAKLDADEIPIKEEYLDFSEVVRESLIEFLPVIQKEQMNLEVTIPEKKCSILADKWSIIEDHRKHNKECHSAWKKRESDRN